MKKQTVLFGDPFKWARNLPFGKFGRSAIGRMRRRYPDKAAYLEPLAAAFELKAGLVLENEELKELEVGSADTFIEEFSDYVTDMAEGAIRYAARGKAGALYQEFFPNGKTEYGNPPKIEMSLLTQRLSRMAVKHAAALPAEVATRLQEFEPRWKAVFEAQEAGKGRLTGDRDEHSGAREAYTKGLVKVIHEIAADDPCNEAHGKEFFDFTLLERGRGQEAAEPAAGATVGG